MGYLAAWVPTLVVVAWLGYGWLAPASLWIEIQGLYVSDSTAPAQPAITFNRDIKRPFLVRWRTTLRKSEDSAFVGVCWHENETKTFPGKPIPKDLGVPWFFERADCSKNLTPGSYQLELVEEWNDLSFIRSISVQSNVFTIWPAGLARP